MFLGAALHYLFSGRRIAAKAEARFDALRLAQQAELEQERKSSLAALKQDLMNRASQGAKDLALAQAGAEAKLLETRKDVSALAEEVERLRRERDELVAARVELVGRKHA